MKKCIICHKEAVYKIKDTSEYYCAECAEDNFGDLSMLVKVQEEAKILKEFIEKKMQNDDSNQESDDEEKSSEEE